MEFPLTADVLSSPPNLHFFSHPATRKIENGTLFVEFENLNLVQRSLDSNLEYFSFVNRYVGKKEPKFLFQNARVIVNDEFKETYTNVVHILNYTTSTDDLVAGQLLISPNPTSDEIRIIGLQETNWELTIVDMFGKTAHHLAEYAPNQPVSLKGIPTGCYHVILQSGPSKITKKLIKID